jgi:hypothetical protein
MLIALPSWSLKVNDHADRLFVETLNRIPESFVSELTIYMDECIDAAWVTVTG